MAEEQEKNEPRWRIYVGKEVSFTLQNETLFGVLNEPQKNRDYADFLPFWSTEADGETVRIEKESPLRVSLSILEDATAIIRPHPNGYMEERAKILNDAKKKKSSAILGFGQ